MFTFLDGFNVTTKLEAIDTFLDGFNATTTLEAIEFLFVEYTIQRKRSGLLKYRVSQVVLYKTQEHLSTSASVLRINKGVLHAP